METDQTWQMFAAAVVAATAAAPSDDN